MKELNDFIDVVDDEPRQWLGVGLILTLWKIKRVQTVVTVILGERLRLREWFGVPPQRDLHQG